jgi:hypothetical protein
MADNMIPPADENPNVASLQKLAANHAAFSVPWPTGPNAVKGVLLHHSFHARELNSWPFYGPCAFDLSRSADIEFAPVAGRDIWTETTTTHVGNNYEHFGISGGIGVGCSSFGASVTVNYDLEMYHNSSSVKISTRTRHIDSILRYKTAPKLDAHALELLRYSGPNAFRDQYGDFYISGFVIGAEAGVCFANGASHDETHQTLSLTVEVHLLFFSFEFTVDLLKIHSSSDKIWASVSAFDTLSHTSISPPRNDMNMGDFLKFRDEYQEKIRNIKGRVDELKKQCGANNVDDFIKRGLVMELVLSPFEDLNEYVETKALWESAKKWKF